MIITLRGANFSSSNIGVISTWSVTGSFGLGIEYIGPSYVIRGEAFTATATLSAGYQLEPNGITVTMGEQVLDKSVYSINGNLITFNIPSATGNITIMISTDRFVNNGDQVSYLFNYMLNDGSGALIPVTGGGSYNARAVSETTLIINKGDSIVTANNNILNIGYAWQDKERKNYLGYIDFDPTTDINWNSSTFTFTDTILIKGVPTEVTYPIYIKMVFKPASGTFTLDDIIANMSYNVSGFIQYDGVPAEEKTVNDITYALNYKVNDGNGTLETSIGSQPQDSRATWSTFVKVNKGDTISLVNENIKFILYAYSLANEESYMGYVDTNIEDETSSLQNWSNSYTFGDTMEIKGVESTVQYPIYVRGVFKTADGQNSSMTLNRIVPFMEFKLA